MICSRITLGKAAGGGDEILEHQVLSAAPAARQKPLTQAKKNSTHSPRTYFLTNFIRRLIPTNFDQMGSTLQSRDAESVREKQRDLKDGCPTIVLYSGMYAIVAPGSTSQTSSSWRPTPSQHGLRSPAASRAVEHISVMSRVRTLRRNSVWMEVRSRTAHMADCDAAALDLHLPWRRTAFTQVPRDTEMLVAGEGNTTIGAAAFGTSRQLLPLAAGGDPAYF